MNVEQIKAGGESIVYANCFPLGRSDTAGLRLAGDASKSGAIIPCDSHEKRLIRMILELLHLSQLNQSSTELPLIIITNDEPKDLMNAAAALFEKYKVFKNILPRITIIQQYASNHTNSKDPTTGIRVVTFPSRAIKFPTHPTPDS